MNRRSMVLDYSDVKTYDAGERVNLVRIDNLKRPGQYEVPAWGNEDFDELAGQRITVSASATKQPFSPSVINVVFPFFEEISEASADSASKSITDPSPNARDASTSLGFTVTF